MKTIYRWRILEDTPEQKEVARDFHSYEDAHNYAIRSTKLYSWLIQKYETTESAVGIINFKERYEL